MGTNTPKQICINPLHIPKQTPFDAQMPLHSRYLHLIPTTFRSVVDVIKLFWRKSRFPPKLKQQEFAILKAIKRFRV